MRYIFGVYGLAGSGKSSVSHYLCSQGWDFVNQDLLGHEVLQNYPQQLAQMFGKDILINGSVDRSILGRKVFADPCLLQQLTEFSYPIIVQRTNEQINQFSNHIVVEGAFFYKIKSHIAYTHLLYVHVDLEILIQRLIKRGHNMEWITQVLKNQTDISMHSSLADYIINNNGSVSELYFQVQKILDQLHK